METNGYLTIYDGMLMLWHTVLSTYQVAGELDGRPLVVNTLEPLPCSPVLKTIAE